MPSVTRSTLPVRSPWPNRQPSIRSAPAISASSAAATAVPRSLCGCTDRQTCSRRVRLRDIHSKRSACVDGVERSTVAGRLRMISRPGPGCQTSHDRLADLQGEVQLGVGEDLGAVLVAEGRLRAQQLLGVLHDQPGAVDGDLLDVVLGAAEDDPAEGGRGRVVQVHGGALGALQGLHGPLDQVLAGLGQYGDRDVVGDRALFDDGAHERRSRSRRRTGSRPRSPCSPCVPAGRTSRACGRATSGRSGPGCRRAGRWRASGGPR